MTLETPQDPFGLVRVEPIREPNRVRFRRSLRAITSDAVRRLAELIDDIPTRAVAQ